MLLPLGKFEPEFVTAVDGEFLAGIPRTLICRRSAYPRSGGMAILVSGVGRD